MQSILTKKEVAQMLKISERTVDTLRKQQGLPYASVGRSIRFDAAAIDAWLRSQSSTNVVIDTLKERDSQVSLN